jgi:hypothetical protein
MKQLENIEGKCSWRLSQACRKEAHLKKLEVHGRRIWTEAKIHWTPENAWTGYKHHAFGPSRVLHSRKIILPFFLAGVVTVPYFLLLDSSSNLACRMILRAKSASMTKTNCKPHASKIILLKKLSCPPFDPMKGKVMMPLNAAFKAEESGGVQAVYTSIKSPMGVTK